MPAKRTKKVDDEESLLPDELLPAEDEVIAPVVTARDQLAQLLADVLAGRGPHKDGEIAARLQAILDVMDAE